MVKPLRRRSYEVGVYVGPSARLKGIGGRAVHVKCSCYKLQAEPQALAKFRTAHITQPQVLASALLQRRRLTRMPIHLMGLRQLSPTCSQANFELLAQGWFWVPLANQTIDTHLTD